MTRMVPSRSAGRVCSTTNRDTVANTGIAMVRPALRVSTLRTLDCRRCERVTNPTQLAVACSVAAPLCRHLAPADIQVIIANAFVAPFCLGASVLPSPTCIGKSVLPQVHKLPQRHVVSKRHHSSMHMDVHSVADSECGTDDHTGGDFSSTIPAPNANPDPKTPRTARLPKHTTERFAAAQSTCMARVEAICGASRAAIVTVRNDLK